MERFWNLKANDSGELHIRVYGVIGGGWWDEEGVEAGAFARDLEDHTDAKQIVLHINSVGGVAFDGIAMYNALRQHGAEVLSIVEGQASSAASVLAMAGRVRMMRGSMMMVHGPAAIAMGEADDMRATADVLDKLRDGLVDIYAAKTGKTAEELQALLSDETWMTAQEAVDAGFADEVDDAAVELEEDGEAIVVNAVRFPVARVAAAMVAMARKPKPADPEPPAAEPPPPAPAPVAITREVLQARGPDLLAALLSEGNAAGAKAERERIQAVEAAALPGHEALLAAAKYGDAEREPMTPEAFALAQVQVERARRAEYQELAAADAAEAAVAGTAAPTGMSDADEARRAHLIKVGAEAGSRSRR